MTAREKTPCYIGIFSGVHPRNEGTGVSEKAFDLGGAEERPVGMQVDLVSTTRQPFDAAIDERPVPLQPHIKPIASLKVLGEPVKIFVELHET